MAAEESASGAREQQAINDLFRRLERGFRCPAVAAELLEPIASFIRADAASIRLMAAEDQHAIPVPLALLNIPESLPDAYRGRFFELDPARTLPRHGHSGPVFADPARPGQWLDVVPSSVGTRHQADFRKYWRRFLKPFDLVHHAGFYIMEEGTKRTLLFDFHRGRRAPPFDDLETGRMHVVARYLHGRTAPRWTPGLSPGTSVAVEGALSARELEVARAVVGGLSNKRVAAALGISVRTVENHMRSIFAKLGVVSRTQLAASLHRQLPG